MSQILCPNTIQNQYLDSLDSRNKVEKMQFRDVFNDYVELMDDF